MNIQTFNYQGLSESRRTLVRQRTSEIKSLMRKTASDIIEIGHKLIEVKEQLPHGEFGEWLETEFNWTDRTARRFMNVATSFKTDNLSDLQIAPSALYMLSEPSTPNGAREEALAKAEQGDPVSYSDAKQLKKKHTGPEIRPEYEEKAEELNTWLDEQVDPETGEIVEPPKTQKLREYIDQMLYQFCIEYDVPVLETADIARQLEELVNENQPT